MLEEYIFLLRMGEFQLPFPYPVGHMIYISSIGSLGEGNSEAYVSNVVVNKAKFIGTTNGVRMKTWQVSLGFQAYYPFTCYSYLHTTNHIFMYVNHACVASLNNTSTWYFLLKEKIFQTSYRDWKNIYIYISILMEWESD